MGCKSWEELQEELQELREELQELREELQEKKGVKTPLNVI